MLDHSSHDVWKASLSGKKGGCSKAQEQLLGACCITEGLVFCATILGRFLLTPNPELTPKGGEWSAEVMDYYNHEVFNTEPKASASPSARLPEPPQHSWEDNFLKKLKNCHHAPKDTQSNTVTTVITPPLPNPPPAPDTPAASVANIASVNISTYAVISVNPGQSTVLSATSQLQVNIGQMSISDSGPKPPSMPGPASTACKVSARRAMITVQAAQPPEIITTGPSTLLIEKASEPSGKHVTCGRAAKASKALK
ncbi:hypothetical protein PAXINDRAFT_7040 [Paxillus involutus ATCC 200175]|nr:hypothetical protein PAXINDRAFT_7040 [Paxillus involutus ATCC 200175]